MNTRPQLIEDPFDRIVREAVREDMARVYNERDDEPRASLQAAAERPSIFLSRQAE